MLMIFSVMNPYSFAYGQKQFGVVALNVFFLTVFFPLVATSLLKMLGLIESIKMEEQKDRIVPLVVTGLFSMWLFANIKNNTGISPMFTCFVLGSTIAVFIGVLCNSFFKISLHTIGMGGMVMGLVLSRIAGGYDDFVINLFGQKTIVHYNLVLIIVIIIAGLVGSSRLVLKAHTDRELYYGYMVGILSQIIAYRFFM